jgi:aryl-alcohol dehydrogenase-like predicted oxidoreductase
MLYTKLGETDLNVSRIAFGTWQAGGDWGAPQEENLKAAIRRALDLSINFFDAPRPTSSAPPRAFWEKLSNPR